MYVKRQPLLKRGLAAERFKGYWTWGHQGTKGSSCAGRTWGGRGRRSATIRKRSLWQQNFSMLCGNLSKQFPNHFKALFIRAPGLQSKTGNSCHIRTQLSPVKCIAKCYLAGSIIKNRINSFNPSSLNTEFLDKKKAFIKNTIKMLIFLIEYFVKQQKLYSTQVTFDF